MKSKIPNIAYEFNYEPYWGFSFYRTRSRKDKEPERLEIPEWMTLAIGRHANEVAARAVQEHNKKIRNLIGADKEGS